MPDQPLIELLDEMLASAEKATKGPWFVFGDKAHVGNVRPGIGFEGDEEEGVNPIVMHGYLDESTDDCGVFGEHNAEFIAAARTTLPAVLAALKVAVERLNAARDQMRYAPDDLEDIGAVDDISETLSTISQLIRSAKQ